MQLVSALVSLLAENLIFTKALGTSTLTAATKQNSKISVMSLVIAGISALSCMMANILFSRFHFSGMLKYPYQMGLPLLYTVIVSVIYLGVLFLLQKLLGEKSNQYKNYVHLSAFNCAVMGTIYLAFAPVHVSEDVEIPNAFYIEGTLYSGFSTTGAIWFGLKNGLSFLVAAWMISAVRERLYDDETPVAFRGFPAMMIFIGIISMAIDIITM
ncbi:MAG: Rnf-Nqr domain containing protein [Oscillospiraceae bacterium]